MLRYHTALGGALICVSTVLLSACGGDSSSPDSTTATSPTTPLAVANPAGLDTYGGGGPLTFTATSAATWSLTGPGSLSATQGASVTYTPPATVQADAQVTITAVSNGTTVAKTITLHAPVLRPVASQVTWYAGDAPIALSISPQFTTGTPTWSSTVGGTFSAAQGNSVTFTPAAVTSDTQAVVSVAASNHTESVSITLKPASEKTLTLNTPSVQAGNGSVTLTVPSTISHGTLKWTASIGTITVNADGSATYTPPATLSGATVVTISATDGSSAPFTATISVTPSAALAVSPTVTSASAAGAPVSLTASIVNPNASVSASMVRWAIASGHGSLSATSGATVSYIPDATDTTVNDTAVVTATLGAMQKTVNITLNFQSSARFNTPYAIAVDGSGNLFVGDSGNNTIRKITVPGVVSTFAGSGAGTEADGTGTAASFLIPVGTAFDSSGNLFVADSVGHAIRKVTPAGVVTTLAGTSSTFGSPVGIAVDAAGNIYVADYVTNLLSKITPAGVITTLAGSGTAGSQDGTGTAASFNAPSGVAVDSNGTLYVAEQKGCNIRKVTPAGVVTTLAGTGVCTHTDGTGTAAAFNMPGSLVVDGNGNVYVTEYKGNTVRKITPAGVVTTLAGSGATGSADGLGTSAQFNYPMGIAIDSNGVLYVTETDNNLIRMVSPTGNVSTVAGAAKASGTADGIALPR
ncbi:SMP-30/gluconolactonase/LRE family protein [Ralstonia insidiosa]|jgi:sugar lactone lactonase YvrE|uniref:Uncharacterized protein n=1 Tax=Ralstonia insidiosa TaxID=190721 RepID=A0A191ZZ22_9RALS|nr:NHL repeat-containing protein [Ralstonia insidiosa]ANJ73374.1 hypothetical protein A9Y76_13230 [Ralstonia insidiosa]KAB0473745.1 hypothetical protein F7R11_14780 [Ralstonia insidiosa]MBY4911154.1 SMP-30/gluconolactonase/LRE family protein [Ralstonia insidiosa]